jgi:hypothetical protein
MKNEDLDSERDLNESEDEDAVNEFWKWEISI